MLGANHGTETSSAVIRVFIIAGYGGFGTRLARKAWTTLVGGWHAEQAQVFCTTLPDTIALRADRNEDIGTVLSDAQTDRLIDAARPFQGSRDHVAEARTNNNIAEEYVKAAKSVSGLVRPRLRRNGFHTFEDYTAKKLTFKEPRLSAVGRRRLDPPWVSEDISDRRTFASLCRPIDLRGEG
tara:strand:- start:52 stop:597 length:546 start_codon:yes stop_codon:yes gene_type:complete